MPIKDFTHQDTISAIATAPGPGGVAIIRISGKQSEDILSKLFTRTTGPLGAALDSHKLYHGKVLHPGTHEVLDSALAVIMRAPASYTGEDIAEIHCHGGYLVPRTVLEATFSLGARPARPGEFTLRAFLNGKMDLAQAEAVADVVNAQTMEGLKQARLQLEGALSERAAGFREALIDTLAEIEARVDFPEEDIDPATKEQIVSSVGSLKSGISSLIQTFEQGRILKEGVVTAIIGRPNVGKSSLLNALLMRERAIVSPHAGTTRDFIEEPLSVGGIPLRLVDTAGLRQTEDSVERMGVELSERKSRDSELIIAVLEGCSRLTPEDVRVLESARGKKAVIVVNKLDLPRALDTSQLETLAPSTPVVHTSARSGEGIDELKRVMVEVISGGDNRGEGQELVLTELRHKLALVDSLGFLDAFLAALEEGLSPEFLALELRCALDSIGEITGETSTETILGRIFSKFCVGK